VSCWALLRTAFWHRSLVFAMHVVHVPGILELDVEIVVMRIRCILAWTN